jgi:hypothetical protein
LLSLISVFFKPQDYNSNLNKEAVIKCGKHCSPLVPYVSLPTVFSALSQTDS